MVYGVADKNAKKEFIIPIYWQVAGRLKVQANSLEEALEWANEHEDEIELDSDAEYLDGTFEIEQEEGIIQMYTDRLNKNKK